MVFLFEYIVLFIRKQPWILHYKAIPVGIVVSFPACQLAGIAQSAEHLQGFGPQSAGF